jgi:hypothetical protein
MGKKGRERVDARLHSTKIEWLPVCELKVDPEGQRALNKTWVAQKAKEFDPDKIGLIVVNRRRGGSTYIIDGQHRVAIILALGWDDQKIECEVFTGLSLEEEAAIFLWRNDRRAVRPYDSFRIRVRAKESVACDIKSIVERAGLTIENHGGGAASVCAVSAMERIYLGAGVNKNYGPKALADTLNIIIEAWGKQSTNFPGVLIEGLGLVKLRYGGNVNVGVLIKRMAKAIGGVPGLIGRARTSKEIHGQSVPRNVAAVIVDLYNRGKREKKLESWWA